MIRELLYADDAAIVAHSLEDVQEISDRFNSAAKDFGLKINIGKTELLYQPADNNDNQIPIVNIEGQPLKAVKCFKYLGSHVGNQRE